MDISEIAREVIEKAEKATPRPWTVEVNGYSGNDWLIGTFVTGNRSSDGNDYSVNVTTDSLHASQYITGDAKTDAEYIVAVALNAPSLARAVIEQQAEITALLKALLCIIGAKAL